MRSVKLAFINALTLFIGLGLLTGSFSSRSAEAARFETVPPLQVNLLGNLRGQYLTVFYAVGTPSLISTGPAQVTLAQIKETRSVQITADTLNIPAVQVEKEGFRPSYNFLVFVVSPQPNYSWVNADGSVPQGSTASNNRQATLVNAVSRTTVEANSASGTLQVQLGK
ncbi:MAG: hypothetical protein AAGB31_12770 [Bdellovibrio sp.]